MALDKKIITDWANQHYRRLIAEDEVWRTTNGYDPTPPEFKQDLFEVELYADTMRDALSENDFTIIEEDARKLLKQAQVDKEALQYKILCRELLKAELKAVLISIDRMYRRYENEELGGWIPDKFMDLEHIAKFKDSPIIVKAKKSGRDPRQWDEIEKELRRIAKEDPDLVNNSRIHICERLSAWYEFEYKKTLKPTTIRDKDLMQSVFGELSIK